MRGSAKLLISPVRELLNYHQIINLNDNVRR